MIKSHLQSVRGLLRDRLGQLHAELDNAKYQASECPKGSHLQKYAYNRVNSIRKRINKTNEVLSAVILESKQ
jgi:hypothetical protein